MLADVPAPRSCSAARPWDVYEARNVALRARVADCPGGFSPLPTLVYPRLNLGRTPLGVNAEMTGPTTGACALNVARSLQRNYMRLSWNLRHMFSRLNRKSIEAPFSTDGLPGYSSASWIA